MLYFMFHDLNVADISVSFCFPFIFRTMFLFINKCLVFLLFIYFPINNLYFIKKKRKSFSFQVCALNLRLKLYVRVSVFITKPTIMFIFMAE